MRVINVFPSSSTHKVIPLSVIVFAILLICTNPFEFYSRSSNIRVRLTGCFSCCVHVFAYCTGNMHTCNVHVMGTHSFPSACCGSGLPPRCTCYAEYYQICIVCMKRKCRCVVKLSYTHEILLVNEPRNC